MNNFEDEREYCNELYEKSSDWLKRNERYKDILVEYELIEACNALVYDRLRRMKNNDFTEVKDDGTGVRSEAGTDIRADGRAQD